jgi:hypothetical protein
MEEQTESNHKSDTQQQKQNLKRKKTTKQINET